MNLEYFKTNKRPYQQIFSLLVIFNLITGCKKMIEVDPPINQIVAVEMYNSEATASAALNGIYTYMGFRLMGATSLSVRAGLSSDELGTTAVPGSTYYALYGNALLSDQGTDLFWSYLYEYIYRANAAIEGVLASTGLSDNMKKRFSSEAKFVRAFMYFYLVNLYGDVPLLISTDLKINSKSGRTVKSQVYDQIIADLKEAQANLQEEYIGADGKTSTLERLRPNKAAATALLARVYLYTEQWALAEEQSDELINNSLVYKLEDLSNVFLKGSTEAIWQLQPTEAGRNTYDAEVFILEGNAQNPTPGPNGETKPVYLSQFIYDDFSSGDLRKNAWVDTVVIGGTTYPYPFKYKAWGENQPRTEYLVVLRLAEQYLIRAEARLRQGKVTGTNSAEQDINIIRNRAGLSPIMATTAEEMADAILQERKLELFTEWGHRWMDLKRANKINEVMPVITPQKVSGATWDPYQSLYPIPLSEFKSNPSLRGHQNPGYPEI